jgi:GntR family transcriptional regulator, transcriptional repressor for pyruvate dehydrogenase complex
MSFTGIDRNPAYLQVAEQIRQAILDGSLAAGSPLATERELCLQFGVSRTTVREALRALQAQGLLSGGGSTSTMRTLVTAGPTSGPLRDALRHLMQLQQVSLRDLVELRCALEGAALSRAARDGDPDRLAEARRALDEMAARGVSAEDFDAADVRFHLALVAASGNAALHLVMLAVRESVASHLLEALTGLRDKRPTFRALHGEHAAILAAVEAGEGERAAELVQQHVLGFYGRFIEAERRGKRRR